MTVTADGAAARKSSTSGTRVLPGGRRGPGAVEHLSRADRVARGKDARAVAPLDSHAEFSPGRFRDPVGLLLGQGASRVPELVPVRHGRMLVSPFTFFRGAALPMAADLAGTPALGLRVQLCGDAHLSNFGAFASPERNLVFDVNDFDETLPGPFEWDVKRLAASLAVAGRDNGSRPRPAARPRWRRACASSGPRSRPKNSRRSRSCWPRPTPEIAPRRWGGSPPWSTGGGRSSATPR
jgi:Uncharacterized protein conserved in bacteria (DUF2252)